MVCVGSALPEAGSGTGNDRFRKNGLGLQHVTETTREDEHSGEDR